MKGVTFMQKKYEKDSNENSKYNVISYKEKSFSLYQWL